MYIFFKLLLLKIFLQLLRFGFFFFFKNDLFSFLL